MSRIVALLLFASVVTLAFRVGGSDDKAVPKVRVDALGDPLPPAALLRLGTLRLWHGTYFTGVIFSGDDRTLYSFGCSAIRAWDAATGKENGEIPFPSEEVGQPLAVSPEARFFARATADKHIAIRDLATGKPLLRMPTGKGDCTCLAFSQDGREFAWVADDVIHLTNLADQRKTRQLKGTHKGVSQLTFSGDGRLLAALVGNGVGVLWDTTTGKRLRDYAAGEIGNVQAMSTLAFDREGKTLFGLVSRKGVVAWETDSLEERYTIELPDANAMALSPDGKTLACTAEGEVKLFLAQSGKAREGPPSPPGSTYLAFSRDGKTLAVAGSDDRLSLLDLATNKDKEVIKHEPILSAGFGKQGREIITLAANQITHWSPAGKALRRVKPAVELQSQSLLSPCGRFVLTLGSPDNLPPRFLDTQSGQVGDEIKVPGIEADKFAAFDRTGRYLALFVREKPFVVHLFAPSTCKKLGQFELPGDIGMQVAFSSDSRVLYVPHPSGSVIQRLDITTGKARQPFRYPTGTNLGMLAVSPDSQTVALQQGERLVHCHAWQGKLLRAFDGADNPNYPPAFSPDGKLIAAGCENATIRIWETATGRLAAVLAGHRGNVRAITFSPDGKRLLSHGRDDTALLWDVAEALRLGIPQTETPKPRSLDALWAELANEDPAAAELATHELANRPDGIAFLSKCMKPVAEVPAARLERLVEQLDSENVAERGAAQDELTALDELARSALEAGQKSKSLEVRRRCAVVLAKLDKLARTGEQARLIRTVEVLELNASPAARKLLADLARGAADARLTREAAAALARLQPGG